MNPDDIDFPCSQDFRDLFASPLADQDYAMSDDFRAWFARSSDPPAIHQTIVRPKVVFHIPRPIPKAEKVKPHPREFVVKGE